MEQKKIVAEEKVIDRSTGVGILIVDQRQVYMAKLLEERGYRLITWDLREGQMPRGKDPIWCAGVLILPVPAFRKPLLGSLANRRGALAHRLGHALRLGCLRGHLHCGAHDRVLVGLAFGGLRRGRELLVDALDREVG